MKKLIPIILLITVWINQPVYSCTSVIIPGKYTKDGRPLLWKNRDADEAQNKMVYFTDGKYPYIGLVNSIDKEGKEIWAGTNSMGFSIMNTVSYNLNKETLAIKDREGMIMKWALMYCASLTDFEKLLDTLSKPYGVESNYGLTDAYGGAAFYETGNFGYKKVDANDPLICPQGFLVHTNFSYSGEYNKGGGYIRYNTAQELFARASQTNDLSVEYILQHCSRCLYHSLTKVNLYDHIPAKPGESCFVPFEDFIPRYISVASVVIQGIKPGEDPSLTTMWTILGWPLASVAVPLWVSGGQELPGIMMEDKSGNSPYCDNVLRLKAQCFPVNSSYGNNYIDLDALLKANGEGILQKILPVENLILKEAGTKLENWRKTGLKQQEIKSFYLWTEDLIRKEYKKLFDLEF